MQPVVTHASVSVVSQDEVRLDHYLTGGKASHDWELARHVGVRFLLTVELLELLNHAKFRPCEGFG